jgi:hypothetical protein
MTGVVNGDGQSPLKTRFGNDGRLSACDGQIFDFVSYAARDYFDPRKSKYSVSVDTLQFDLAVSTFQRWAMDYDLTVFNKETQKEDLRLRVKFGLDSSGMISGCLTVAEVEICGHEQDATNLDATSINFDFSGFITSFNLIPEKDRQLLVDEKYPYEATFHFLLLFIILETWLST